MSNMLEKAKNLLGTDESIHSYLLCSYDSSVSRNVLNPGILMATNKRVVFLGQEFVLKLKNKINKELEYSKILSIKEKRGLLVGKRIVIDYDNNWVVFKLITDGEISSFIETVEKNRKVG